VSVSAVVDPYELVKPESTLLEVISSVVQVIVAPSEVALEETTDITGFVASI